MSSDDKLIRDIFGLREEKVRSTLKLAQRGNLSSVDSQDIKNLFHVYTPAIGENAIIKKNCHILIPKKENLNELRPDNLQWYDLYAFFNLISTIDMSLAVPYMQITWYEYNEKNEAIEIKQTDRVIRQYHDPIKGDIINDSDLYFKPQTYYASSENKFRPFLGIKSFDVDIQNPIGMIATKYATLSLTLFDTTRLAEARRYIYPGKFAPLMEIEYGWSHPDTSTFAGKFINARRDTAFWRVANYTVTVDQNNTADIRLELYSMVAYKIVRAHLIPNGKTSEAFIGANQKTQTEINKLNNEIETRQQKLSEGGLSKQEILKTENEIQERTSASWKLNNPYNAGEEAKSKRGKSIAATTSTSVATIQKSLKKLLKEFFENVFKKENLRKSFEKFLNVQKISEDIFQAPNAIKDFKNKDITQLAILLLYIFGTAIPEAEGENENVETQLIFFNFNQFAHNMRNKNIGSFLIPLSREGIHDGRGVGFLDKINNFILKTKILNPPIVDIFNIINLEYLSNPIDVNFGFDTDRFEVSKKQRVNKDKKPTGRYDKTVTGHGEKFYDHAKATGYVQPSIKMYIVEGPDKKNKGKTIRRVFIYDQAERSRESDLKALRDEIDSSSDTPENSRKIVRSQIPFVQVGTERTTLKNVTFQTINDPLMQSIFMQRIELDSDGDTTVQKKHIPAQFLPMTARLNIYGFPDMMFGSKLFMDMRTGSTIDNIYRITAIKHTWSPNDVSTDVELTPDDAWLHQKVEKKK